VLVGVHSSPLPVEHLFADLVSDNIAVIKAVQDHEIQVVVNLLRTAKNPAYLEILSALCVCGKDSVPEQQLRVTNLLLEQNQDVLYHTEYAATNHDVLVCEESKANTWVSLRT
jgi:hypothetical protein